MKNFKKKLILGFAVMAMIAPAANATAIDDDPTKDSAVEVTVAKDFPIVITNNTGEDIEELYISSTGDDDWSENRLNETLHPGESVRLICVDAGKYDVSIAYANGDECELYEVNFQQSTRITISHVSGGKETIFSY